MAYKVKTQPNLSQGELVTLLTLGCVDTSYMAYPDVIVWRAEATPEQCEQLKSLSYVQSVEVMPIYKAQ